MKPNILYLAGSYRDIPLPPRQVPGAGGDHS